MTIEDIVNSKEFQSVVEDYRGMCLWFAGDVLHPKNRVQMEQVLSSIEANGDMDAYKRVGRIRRWLRDGSLFNGPDEQLSAAMEAGDVVFHEGRICGAWPQIVG